MGTMRLNRFKMLSSPIKPKMMLGALLLLTACAPQTPSSGSPDAFCAIAHPLTWSQKDTDETIIGIKEHNAVGVKLCGWH
jgi:hypothetical protein